MDCPVKNLQLDPTVSDIDVHSAVDIAGRRITSAFQMTSQGNSYMILKMVRHFREKKEWSLAMHLHLKQISASYFHWLRFHPGHRAGEQYLHSQFGFKQEEGGFHSITK